MCLLWLKTVAVCCATNQPGRVINSEVATKITTTTAMENFESDSDTNFLLSGLAFQRLLPGVITHNALDKGNHSVIIIGRDAFKRPIDAKHIIFIDYLPVAGYH